MKWKVKVRRRIWVTTILVIAVLVTGLFVWNMIIGLKRPKTLQDLADKTANIEYCQSDDKSQTLDFYKPKNTYDSSTLPLVIYIHGGGWRRGDKNGPLLHTYAPLFIDHGMEVAAINYRLHTLTPYPDQNNDIACALSYLTTNATRLHINTKKIIYFGDSAGGQLAAFAALNIPYRNYIYDVPAGVIDFYGVSNFSNIIDGPHADLNARRYLGERYALTAYGASPSSYVTKKAPRFLFFHGTNDKTVPVSQSKLLYDMLIGAGIDAEYVTVLNTGHGFIGPELSSSIYKDIRDNMDTFVNEILH